MSETGVGSASPGKTVTSMFLPTTFFTCLTTSAIDSLIFILQLMVAVASGGKTLGASDPFICVAAKVVRIKLAVTDEPPSTPASAMETRYPC